MNIIVTGGAGFIGSNFIFYLLGHHPEDRVICLDKLTYAGNLETLAPVMDDPRFRFVRADIADAEAVDRLFEEEKPDIVVNFAAESHVDRSITDPCIFVRTNVMGTQVLMEVAVNTVCGASTKYPPTRCTAICLWIGRTCFSPRKRRCTHPRPIRPARPEPICWCWPMPVRLACR